MNSLVSTHLADRYWVLLAVCVAGLILPLEYTGPAMALPAIQRDIGGSSIALAWVVNAFALSFGSTVMASGTLADQFGRRRIFCLGISSFAILSAFAGLANDLLMLDLIRGAQGIAAALTMAGGAATLAQVFDGRARTKAFGLLGTTFGLGLAFGPLAAGVLIEIWNWRSIFFIGTLLGGSALLFGLVYMPESKDPGARRLDKLGILSFTLFLVLLTFGIMQIPQSGWKSLTVIGLLTSSALVLFVFIHTEASHDRPMLDLSLFRYPKFIGVLFLSIATAVCFIVLLILMPIRLVGIDGMSEVQAGLVMVALSAPMLFVPFLAALLTRWVNAATLSSVGLFLAAIGLGWLSFLPVGTPWGQLVPPLLMIGLGTGLPWGLMDDLAISVVPIERAGMATGIFTTTRACGEAICVAVSLVLLNGFLQHALQQITDDGVAGLNNVEALASSLALGDMALARQLAPHLDVQVVYGAYAEAFSLLLIGLMTVTLSSAFFCKLMISKEE